MGATGSGTGEEEVVPCLDRREAGRELQSHVEICVSGIATLLMRAPESVC